MSEITGVYVDIIIRDGHGRFLLQHHPDSHVKPWRFPGGKPKPGETFIAAVAREAKEELGIEPLSLRYVGSGHSDTEAGLWLGHMFLCEAYVGVPRLVEYLHDALDYVDAFYITGEPERTFARRLAFGQIDSAQIGKEFV